MAELPDVAEEDRDVLDEPDPLADLLPPVFDRLPVALLPAFLLLLFVRLLPAVLLLDDLDEADPLADLLLLDRDPLLVEPALLPLLTFLVPLDALLGFLLPPLELLLDILLPPLEPLLDLLPLLLEPLDLLLLVVFVVGTIINSPLSFMSICGLKPAHYDYTICYFGLVFPGIHKRPDFIEVKRNFT